MNIKKGQRWKNIYHKNNVTIKSIENGVVFYRISDDENDYCGMPVDAFLEVYVYDGHVQIGQRWLFSYPDDFYFTDNCGNSFFIDVLEITSNGHEVRCVVTFDDGVTLENEVYLTDEFKSTYFKRLS